MGIRTPVSTNYAMTLGGLKQGVTPLDMAHAFQTFAANGNLVSGHAGHRPTTAPSGSAASSATTRAATCCAATRCGASACCRRRSRRSAAHRCARHGQCAPAACESRIWCPLPGPSLSISRTASTGRGSSRRGNGAVGAAAGGGTCLGHLGAHWRGSNRHFHGRLDDRHVTRREEHQVAECLCRRRTRHGLALGCSRRRWLRWGRRRRWSHWNGRNRGRSRGPRWCGHVGVKRNPRRQCAPRRPWKAPAAPGRACH